MTPATETEDGLEKRTCTREGCTATEERVLPKTGHVHGLEHFDKKDATCTQDGNIEYWRCNKGDDPCRLYFKDAEATQWAHEEGIAIHATGHDWGEWTVIAPATEKEMGAERRTCKNNPFHFQFRVIPQKDHVHGLVHFNAKAPTCEEGGNIEYWKCLEGEYPCGLCYKDAGGEEWVHEDDIPVPALGHDWGEWVVTKPATATAEGEEARTCERCGKVETRAIPIEVTYRYVGPDNPSWTKGTSDALALTFKRSYADEQTYGLFTGVEVDGVAVPEKDASGKANYAAESGSLVLKLQPSYLEALGVGDHAITVFFEDGDASTTFAVKDSSTASTDSESATTKAAGAKAAKTGDAVLAIAIVGTIVAAALALAALVIARRKRRV